MFSDDNTEGFSVSELDEMNTELSRRLESNELEGLPEYEREKAISEEILRRF
jgi:hypothetical protein